jgi:FkbM family methyltransferase
MADDRPSVKRRMLVQARLLVQRAGYDVVRENFKHRFVFALHQHAITSVLDIGANTGQFGAALRRADFRGDIVSVEPLQDAFDALLEATRTDVHWSAERAAVSDQPGTVTMNVSANSVSSSVLPMLGRHTEAAPQTSYVAVEQVPATTIDHLVERHGLVPESTLLKIDVQGYEKSVLDGAANTLPRFAAVRIEMSLVPLYQDQTLMPEMIEYLTGQGLELWLVEPGFTEPSTRRLLQLDGVFFR